MTGTLTLPVTTVDKGAVNVPVQQFDSLEDLAFSPTLGALRYQVRLDDRGTLDALLLPRNSRELVVVFHGAMVKEHHHLPRFEWLKTLSERTDYSCLFISDPTLTLDPKLLLAWYLGWEGMDLYPLLAEVSRRAADAAGADRLVLTGSSGGGYAALQTSFYLPGSLAIPFNAQTALNRYHWNAQASYISRIMPHMKPSEGAKKRSWVRGMGDRASAVKRYRRAGENHVLVVQNVNDEHHYAKHYLPFAEAVAEGPNRDRVHFEEYSGPSRHEPPSRGRFVETVRRGAHMMDEWSA